MCLLIMCPMKEHIVDQFTFFFIYFTKMQFKDHNFSSIKRQYRRLTAQLQVSLVLKLEAVDEDSLQFVDVFSGLYGNTGSAW